MGVGLSAASLDPFVGGWGPGGGGLSPQVGPGEGRHGGGGFEPPSLIFSLSDRPPLPLQTMWSPTTSPKASVGNAPASSWSSPSSRKPSCPADRRCTDGLPSSKPPDVVLLPFPSSGHTPTFLPEKGDRSEPRGVCVGGRAEPPKIPLFPGGGWARGRGWGPPLAHPSQRGSQ